MAVHQRHLPSMGSSATVIVVGGTTSDIDHAVRRLRQLEARWSRFLPDSEVSRLNRLGGPTNVDLSAGLSSDTATLLARAADGFRITRGRFDPYRLAEICDAGYDRPHGIDGRPLLVGGDSLATMVPRRGFDPGGIGKGLAADLVTGELIERGVAGALVSIGGDLRVRGESPHGESWHIDIEDPRGADPVARVRLDDGAVATSSQVKRRWVAADGSVRHHLIDPSTGTSADSPVLSSTVVAAEAWQAEVLAKVTFLDAFGHSAISEDTGLELVESLGAAALVVTDGLELSTSRWARYDCPVTVGAAK